MTPAQTDATIPSLVRGAAIRALGTLGLVLLVALVVGSIIGNEHGSGH